MPPLDHPLRHARLPRVVALTAVLLALAAGLGQPPPAAGQGRTITVTSTADSDDHDGSCDPDPGGCTLREAIIEANDTPGRDTIVLPPGATIELDCVAADPCGPEEADSFDLDITEAVVIEGNGAVVDASPLGNGSESRVVDVRLTADRAPGDVVLRSLIVLGGDVNGLGGGIRFHDHTQDTTPPGVLVVEQVVAADNLANGGGGIAITGGDATLRDVTLGGNMARGLGGGLTVARSEARGNLVVDIIDSRILDNGSAFKGAGIAVEDARLELHDSVVAGNGTRGDAFPSHGGGLYLLHDATALVERSYLLENSATRRGGGVDVDDARLELVDSTLEANRVVDVTADEEAGGGGISVMGGVVAMANSTFEGNLAEGERANGGALLAGPGEDADVGAVLVSHVTFSGNQADGPGDTMAVGDPTVTRQVGPVAAEVSLFNSVISGAHDHCLELPAGRILTLGGNIEDTDSCDQLDPLAGDLVERDPRLGPLEVPEGMLTPVRSLRDGSPAIDSALDSADGVGCEPTDQLGHLRPADGDGDGTTACDRGAVEVNALPPAPDPGPDPGPGPGPQPDPEPQPDPTVPEAEVPDEVERISGLERIETAVEASRLVFDDDEAGAVVLTRADDFADAQVGVPLAVAVDGPILSTYPDRLHDLTEEEVRRVLPDGGTVYLLGGEAALSADVADRLDALGHDVVRLGGPNRFATAVVVAHDGLGDPARVVVADGQRFADSILAGTAAAALAEPAAVLLSAGNHATAELQGYLSARGAVELHAIGDGAVAAVPHAITSVPGTDPADLSVAVSAAYFPRPRVVALATSTDFADALTGGAVVARDDVGPGPVLLTLPDQLPAVLADHLADLGDDLERVLLLGGTAAVSEDVAEEVLRAVRGDER